MPFAKQEWTRSVLDTTFCDEVCQSCKLHHVKYIQDTEGMLHELEEVTRNGLSLNTELDIRHLSRRLFQPGAMILHLGKTFFSRETKIKLFCLFLEIGMFFISSQNVSVKLQGQIIYFVHLLCQLFFFYQQKLKKYIYNIAPSSEN